jgi:hypothetical protein
MAIEINKLFVGMLMLFFLAGFICAQSVSINLEKTIFYPEEEISVNVVVQNTGNNVESLELDLGISHGNDLYSFETISQQVALKSSETRELNFKFKVEKFASPGKYIVEAVLWDGIKKVNSEIKSIEISGTDKSFDFVIQTYEDKLENSNIFLRGESVNLNYNSEISGVEIDANLIYPDKTKRKITLPTSITAEQTGTYELVIVASKEGYETITRRKQFTVVSDKKISIESASVCNSNGVCDNNENYKICSQDCKPSITKRYPKASISVSVLVLLGLLYLLKNKKKFFKRK